MTTPNFAASSDIFRNVNPLMREGPGFAALLNATGMNLWMLKLVFPRFIGVASASSRNPNWRGIA